MIDIILYGYNESKSRTYIKNARKDYLAFAKQKKRSKKSIQKVIKKQLQHVRRDIAFIDIFLKETKYLSLKDNGNFEVIRKVYEQQLYIHKNNRYTFANRIVSIFHPYIRPIVRGKAKIPTEFGTKLDLSIDEQRVASLERLSFYAYNEALMC